MRTYVRLVRHLIGAAVGMAALRYDRRNGKRVIGRTVLFGILMLYVSCIFMLMTGGFGFALFTAGPDARTAALGLTMILTVGQLGGVFLELRSIGGMLGWSKDSPLLFSLPLRRSTVFLARMTMTVGGPLFVQFLLLGPFFFFWMGWAGWGLSNVLKALLVLACAPLIPTLVAGVLSMILVRVSILSRHRDLLLTVMGIASVLIAVPLSQWVTTTMVSSIDQNTLLALMNDPAGIITLIARVWPPAHWAAIGMTTSGAAGWGYLALYAAFSAAAIGVTALIGVRLYQKGAVAQNETTVRHRRRTLRVGASSAFSALVAREWKLLLRSPTYAVNGLAGILMGPLFAVMFAFTPGGLDEFRTVLPTSSLGVGLMGISLFAACCNMVPSTALSREGSTLWVLKMLPIRAQDIVRAKLVMGCQAGMLGSAVMIAVMGVVLSVPLGVCLLAGLIMALANLAMTGVFLLIDLTRPKLAWESETAAMKQNLNGGIAMGVGLGMSIIFILPMILLPGGWGYVGAVVLTGVAAAVAVGVTNGLAEPLIRRAGS